MLKKLIDFSIENAALVLVMGVLLVLLAIYAVPRMPVDVFPELNAPSVTIMTEAPGYAADEVEQYITFPIESSVNGLPGIRRVRSSSAIGLSIVWVDFDWGEDIYRARYLVSERLALAEGNLPENVHCEIAPVTSITGEIMLISLSSPDSSVDPLSLRAYGEYELRNRLLAVPGISQVVAIGGELPEYQVNVNQDRLRLYDLTIQDVVEAAEKAHSTAGAGYLLNFEGREIPLRQTARIRSVDDIRSTVIRYEEGVPITIGRVADVELAGALKRGTASESGIPAVVLSIQKAPGTNTLELTKAIDVALDEVESALPHGIKLNRHVVRQSDFIQLSLQNVITVARDAAIIVTVVLLLFLMNIRTTIITLVAIPLSIALTFLVMKVRGQTINIMTLGGIAVAIGIVVDDGIIFVENVYRRLRENQTLPEGQQLSHALVIRDACSELLGSVLFATIIIVVVFVPLLFLHGLEGRFFRPLGESYMIAVLASLLVAVTVTVAMCRYLLRGKLGRNNRDGFVVRGLKKIYSPVLKTALRFKRTTVFAALVLTLLSIKLVSTFGTSFLPEFNEGTLTVFVIAPPGTSLEESARLAHGVEKRFTEIEGVRSVVRRTGRAERDEHAEPVSFNEIDVAIKPGYTKEDVRHKIDAIIKQMPGVTTMIGQPIEHRLSHVMSGTPAAIAINVYGENLHTLRKIAKEIEAVLKDIPGARDVAANREIMITTLPVRYRHNDMARWGLTPADAAEQLKTAMFGQVITTVNEGVRQFDLVVRLAEDQRQNPDQVRNFLLRGSGGALVRLEEVADIGPEQASNLIARDNTQRKATISCNVAEGHNLGHLVAEVREKVDPIVRNYGYSVRYGGQFEAQQSASKTILLMGGIVVIMILLLLNMSLGSTRSAFLVIANLPLALIGGILAIFIAESDHLLLNTLALFGIGNTTYVAPVVSIAGMVGFITLFGIAVRNGILLINHYSWLSENEGITGNELIIRGAEERLVPILMTALTAVLGLFPFALRAGQPGSELLAPMAIVILGGLATSTVLNLIIIPAGYAILYREKE